MTFREAVNASPRAVRNSFRPGKQALGTHAAKVICVENQRITGSVDIDSALHQESQHAQAPRWDYGLGYRPPNGNKEFAMWVEVHSAETSEVRAVVRKLTWLKDYLMGQCPDLWKITHSRKGDPTPFIWVASKGVHISRNSPHARLLAQHGLDWPTKLLKLP
jgi:hypothetical protein